MAEKTGTRSALRRLGYAAEAVGAFLAYGVFAALPVDAASGLGGWIGRSFGPRLPLSQRAVAHITAAFPDKPRAEIDRIVRLMWDMLGRIAGEYPHLDAITRDAGKPGSRIAVEGRETVELLRRGGAALLFSGHIANWELYAPALAALGIPYAQVYRDPNNPFVSWLVRRVRRLPPDAMIPKGAAGARQSLATLARGGRLGMLIDQKMNDGIAVPFFGRDAMTAPALARLALRFGCPPVPVRLERLGGARFRLIFYPPLPIAPSGDRDADTRALTARATRMIEDWIRERPEQWLWLHRRWPDPAATAAPP